jgi:hypothetical protein
VPPGRGPADRRGSHGIARQRIAGFECRALAARRMQAARQDGRERVHRTRRPTRGAIDVGNDCGGAASKRDARGGRAHGHDGRGVDGARRADDEPPRYERRASRERAQHAHRARGGGRPIAAPAQLRSRRTTAHGLRAAPRARDRDDVGPAARERTPSLAAA